MFGFLVNSSTTVIHMSVAVVLILAVSRVLSIFIALHGVPPKRRAEVLKALAQCYRWWRWRN